VHINDIWNAGISNGSKLVAFASHIFLYRSVHSQGDHMELQQNMVGSSLHASWSSSSLLKGYASLSQNVLVQSTLPKWNTCQGCWFYPVSWNIYSLLIQHNYSVTTKARRLMGLLFRQFYYNADTSTLNQFYESHVWPHLYLPAQYVLHSQLRTMIF